MLERLRGYRTIIGMILAFAVALWQTYIGPLPGIDPNTWTMITAVFGIFMRMNTSTRVGEKR